MTQQEDPLENLDVQHIKLSDGNEIIAYINSFDSGFLVVERPMNINLVTAANGFDTYFFTKYFPFSKHNVIRIHSRNIISASEVSNEIKERYIKAATGTHEDHEEEDDDRLSDQDLNLNFMDSPSKKYH